MGLRQIFASKFCWVAPLMRVLLPPAGYDFDSMAVVILGPVRRSNLCSSGWIGLQIVCVLFAEFGEAASRSPQASPCHPESPAKCHLRCSRVCRLFASNLSALTPALQHFFSSNFATLVNISCRSIGFKEIVCGCHSPSFSIFSASDRVAAKSNIGASFELVNLDELFTPLGALWR